MQVPFERVIEKTIEVPIERVFERVVHVPQDEFGGTVDKVVWRNHPVFVDNVVYNDVLDSPYLFQYHSLPTPPPAAPNFKWIPISTAAYNAIPIGHGAPPPQLPPSMPGAYLPGPLPGTPPGQGISIANDAIYVSPECSPMDERREIWGNGGRDSRPAGFHRGDPRWDQDFDEFDDVPSRRRHPDWMNGKGSRHHPHHNAVQGRRRSFPHR